VFGLLNLVYIFEDNSDSCKNAACSSQTLSKCWFTAGFMLWNLQQWFWSLVSALFYRSAKWRSISCVSCHFEWHSL